MNAFFATNPLKLAAAKREVPEEMKPRRIEIASAQALPAGEAKQIEADKHAA